MAMAPGGDIAHAPTCGAFGSDFGVMLGWVAIAAAEAKKQQQTLCVCDDPWLFRQIASLSHVTAGRPPRLMMRVIKSSVRGISARLKVAVSTALASLRLRQQRRTIEPGSSILLAYGHPESNAEGFDAYFGGLMQEIPLLRRALHADCPASRARALAGAGHTVSLHGWGNPFFALGALPLTRWRPTVNQKKGPYGWLIKRAASRENGGGGPAMSRWQQHCQARFLMEIRPARIVWPWENHGWERALCRTARLHNLVTVGYQHTVVGPHQINYSVAANTDGVASIPDFVVCNGPVYRDELAAWGVPEERLSIGGAFRFRDAGTVDMFDPAGPVFIPLSAIPAAAALQVAAARRIAATGRRAMIKEHPMYPFPTKSDPMLTRCDTALRDQHGIAAVLYSTGASGLDAILAGVPAFRLLLEDNIAIDVLPPGLPVETVDLGDAAERIEQRLAGGKPAARIDWDSILSRPDTDFWRRLLGMDSFAAIST
ncbi:MAG: hypothetical protein HOM58_21025 [Rhodospirillaceae bacterium]|nr:hypothetical protein [Rhodospirillaceae bacterium]MBT5459377.1 hypothetical protein [Rhodospirillaceae bacterium]